MPDDPVTAIAKAVEESAKAAGKGIDAAVGFGRFVERIIGPALEECALALAEKARWWRMSRLLRLEARYGNACEEMGPNRVSKPVEPKFALALLEAASL